jgi:hypothetical protein
MPSTPGRIMQCNQVAFEIFMIRLRDIHANPRVRSDSGYEVESLCTFQFVKTKSDAKVSHIPLMKQRTLVGLSVRKRNEAEDNDHASTRVRFIRLNLRVQN